MVCYPDTMRPVSGAHRVRSTGELLMKTYWIAGLIVLALLGCRKRDAQVTDNQIVWDKNGCAYYVQPDEWADDKSALRRTPGVDKPPCLQTNPFEAMPK